MLVYDRPPEPRGDSGTVLIVEDEPELRTALRRILLTAGHAVFEASSLAGALDVLEKTPIDVLLLDLGLPDGSGMSLVPAVQASWPSTTVVVLTASNALEDMRQSLRLGAGSYLHKPVDALTLEAQISGALAQRRALHKHVVEPAKPTPAPGSGDLGASLEELPLRLASQLSHAWDLRHVETGAHVRRLAESTRIMALALGTSDAEASRLGRVAMLHDIGKIAIPDAILTKPGRLTDDELVIMKRHAEIGGALMSGSGHPFLDLAATVARHHHERWNGSGYPDGLAGDDCPWQARLVGVVDVFDALGHARSYKAAWSRQSIFEFFEAEAGRLFEPELVETLLASIPRLEQVNSEYPDPIQLDYASGSRLKSAGASAELVAQKLRP